MKDHRIDSDIAVDGTTITAIVDGEEQDEYDIIGYSMIYTIGSDFLIAQDETVHEETGREWLIRRLDELGLPEWMAPPKVTSKRGFNRTRDFLLEVPPRDIGVDASALANYGKTLEEVEIGGRTMTFETNKATTDEWHLNAKAYFTADELNQDDGEFRTTTVAIARYDKEHGGMTFSPKVSEGDSLWDACEVFSQAANKLFYLMQTGHIGRDIQKMLNRYTSYWTKSIKMRDGGAVYFVPSGYDDSVQGLKALINELNHRFKTHGRTCELITIPVMDSDELRQEVERRAVKSVEAQVENAIDAALSALGDDDAIADDIAASLEERLEDIESFANDYNALLSARLSARSVVKERLSELSGEKGDVVERALGKTEVAP